MCNIEKGSFIKKEPFPISAQRRYPLLSYLRADRNGVIHKYHFDTVGSIGSTDHSVAVNTSEFDGFKVSDELKLLSYEVFGGIVLCDARNDLSAAHAVIKL